MKSTLEDISNLEKQLKIEVPGDKVKEEFLKAYKYLQKEVDMKGFRKGKAPIAKIKAIYGDRIKSDVAQNIVQDTYWNALQEHNLTPVSMPSIDFGELSEDESFNFTATFEIRPEVKINKKSGFQVEKEKLDISEERINGVIDNIRQSHATYEPVKLIRPLKEGDFAMIDFEGYVDDKPLENGSAKDHMLEIGANQFIPGFEEALIGMQKDETKSISLRFPEDYHVQELKGKPVVFKVSLKDIKTKQLPELNEEFLKKIDQSSIDELKNQIKQEVEQSEKRRIESETRDQLIKAFVDANPVEVPKALFEEQRKALVNDFQNRLKQQGFSDENFQEYQDKWNEDFDKTATFMVQSAFLIDQLSDEENLKATNADVDNKIEEMAKQVGMEKEKVAAFYKEKNGLSKLEYQITEDKVYDYLLKNSTITEVEKKKEDTQQP